MMIQCCSWFHGQRNSCPEDVSVDTMRFPGATYKGRLRPRRERCSRLLSNLDLSYVSSIYTFGNYPGETQRIRLPHETLSLSNANCIDVSVVFASAMENLGMQPWL